MMLSQRAEEGLEKSAILMLALGEDGASEVMRHLNPKEVQRLGSKMTKTGNITVDRVDDIMKELLDYTSRQSALGLNSSGYIKSVLNKALGEEKASYLLDSILTSSDTSGIEGLKWMEPQTVAELIKNEHPQIIATIMVHLERDHCAAILNHFNGDLKSEVVLRIATLDGIQPNALKELNDVLSKLLANGGDKITKKALGGPRTAAEILNFVGITSEKHIIDSISSINPELSAQIEDEMFTFENILDLQDRDVQKILRRVDMARLCVAMKGISPDIEKKIFSNMAVRVANALREDIEIRGAVKISEIESAQKEILKLIREMSDAEEITLLKGGENTIA